MHPIVTELAEALARDAGSRAEIVRGDNHNWLAIEETSSTITFVEAEGTELRIVPFVGDAEAVGARSFVNEIRPSWLDGEHELVADVSALASYADRGQVIDLMHAALDYWVKSAETPTHEHAPAPEPVVETPTRLAEVGDVDFSGGCDRGAVRASARRRTADVDAQMRADISDEWSWASSVAKIPQITDLTISLTRADRARTHQRHSRRCRREVWVDHAGCRSHPCRHVDAPSAARPALGTGHVAGRGTARRGVPDST